VSIKSTILSSYVNTLSLSSFTRKWYVTQHGDIVS
jgi:hypothetical protein